MSSADTPSRQYVAMKSATINKDLLNIDSTALPIEPTDSILVQKDSAGTVLRATVANLVATTSPSASLTTKGVIQVASLDEMNEGIVDDKAIAPNTFKNVLDTKQNNITGAATSILTNNLNTNTVTIADSNGKIASSSITTSELQNISGSTSNLQSQISSIVNSKGQANGIASLNSNGKIPASQISDAFSIETFEVASQAAMLNLTIAKKGDIALRTDINATFILSADDYANINNWEKFLTNKNDIGLSNVDNTSDLNKPISTATQTALNLKANQSATYTKTETDNKLALKQNSLTTTQLNAVNSGVTSSKITSYDSHISNTSNPHSVTKTQIGLGNVDNTSDLNKPISTATQTALTGLSTDITALETDNNTNVKTVNNIAVSSGTKNIVLNKLKNPLRLNDAIKVEAIASTIDASNDATSITLEALSDSAGPKGGEVNIIASSSARGPHINIKSEGAGAGGDIFISATGDSSSLSLTSETVSIAATTLNINAKPTGTGVSSAVSSTSTNNTLATSKAVYDIVNTKQNTLTAGTNITISGNTISSKDTTYSPATTSANGLMSSTDKTKLDGIAAGAQVNTVTSVAGKTGAVTLSKSDVGLSNVDNTSDANKPISTATQTALNLKQNKLATYSEDLALSSGSITAKSSTGNQDSKVLEFNTSSSDYPYCNMDIGKGNYTSNVNIGNNTYQTYVTVAANSSTAAIEIKPVENISFILGAATHDILKVNSTYDTDISEITLNGELKGTAIDTSVDYTNISSNSTTRVPNTNAVATSLGSVVTTTQTALNLKQNITDSSLNTTAKTIVGAINEVRKGYFVTSTTTSSVTPTASQTGTVISSSTNSGRVIINPNINNVGAVYLLEGTSYNNANPIYPDPTNNTYIFNNLSNAYLFVDTVGDSVGITVEIFG